MKKSINYFIWDGIVASYIDYYGNEWEDKLAEELQKYLSDLVEKSELKLITGQDITKVSNWLKQHNLYQYIADISNREF